MSRCALDAGAKARDQRRIQVSQQEKRKNDQQGVDRPHGAIRLAAEGSGAAADNVGVDGQPSGDSANSSHRLSSLPREKMGTDAEPKTDPPANKPIRIMRTIMSDSSMIDKSWILYCFRCLTRKTFTPPDNNSRNLFCILAYVRYNGRQDQHYFMEVTHEIPY